MPYIEQKDRDTYDADIKSLSVFVEKTMPNRSSEMKDVIGALLNEVYYPRMINRHPIMPAPLVSIIRNIPGDMVARPGHLNYIISSLIDQVYGTMRYTDYNEVEGVLGSLIKKYDHVEIEGMLGCAQKEFYRRRTAPYEDLKITANGDIR